VSHPLDLCECGDFRRDHLQPRGHCRLCRSFPYGMPPCHRFRFSRPAPPEEIAEQERLERALEEALAASLAEDIENERANALVRDGW